MKATEFIKPGDVELVDTPKPKIEKPTDAIIKVVRASVCGSDLWWYRGIDERKANTFVGHEAIGIVDSVGSDVKDVKPGDFVIAPFTHGCGHCAACLAGFDGNCMNQEKDANIGYQAQYFRYINANWGLVKIPGQPEDYSDEMLKSLVTLSDVMATGYHAAASAEVKDGDTVVVMGDGAVGLCGVIAAKLRGAKRIIAMSRHEDRQKLAKEFGATDIVPERGDEAVKHVMELTDGAGADAILECVGTEQSVDTATKVARPGAVVGRVGIPQKAEMNTNNLFFNNTGLRGGIAPVTTYDREVLLKAVLDGKINPGKVFTKEFDLDHIQDAYDAMDKRKAIKSLVIVDKD
ncbi:zinc-dependent alcohol dehydrogenase family protein [Fructilactobacillus fructivorans]|uniref:Zinc-binding dehydrogenase n=1 Tax=Fructilactobacillus fructivorans TaxID=1614 RepID=A0AAE6TXK9_9LACO|nr:zinc-dependent alcohol dehydrogenase family protein [Fructilactobacillus fructivorans]KRK56891.1 alcohol dehydrogenase [Fructilactobacillus fructivorans]KRN43060.1 alcohol dehydrogenase [Fructilactobacillus fructivorans]QFX93253.1 zinc-binding dehydrogenase [Fructilactobacillus fructivorans]RDV65073.1 Zn-dependent alcohol dehydrogenase [Fructilactobacillus fructivorans]